jgi:hypothetical protein
MKFKVASGPRPPMTPQVNSFYSDKSEELIDGLTSKFYIDLLLVCIMIFCLNFYFNVYKWSNHFCLNSNRLSINYRFVT